MLEGKVDLPVELCSLAEALTARKQSDDNFAKYIVVNEKLKALEVQHQEDTNEIKLLKDKVTVSFFSWDALSQLYHQLRHEEAQNKALQSLIDKHITSRNVCIQNDVSQAVNEALRNQEKLTELQVQGMI